MLSSDKTRLLQQMLQKRGISVAGNPVLARRAEAGPCVLSFGQQRLWFLHQLEPESPAYNIPFALELAGRLEVAVLSRSFDEIVRRHEALCTRFQEMDGQPVQIVTPGAAADFAFIDLSGLPAEIRRIEAQRLRSAEAPRSFQLERDPLLRIRLLRLADEEHQIALTFHHIASDGWSIGVLVREVNALYPAFSTGSPSPLQNLHVQYPDYSVWQRAWLQGEVLERQLAFWRERLCGAWPTLDLPVDRPRREASSRVGAVHRFTLPADLAAGLRCLARQRSATLFMTLLALFQALLARVTGQADVAVGSPMANRNRAEIEGLIGFFVNTVVLWTDLSGDRVFNALLDRVREVALEAQAHQDLPFEKLVEEMAPKRGQASPLQVMFSLQNVAIVPFDLPGLTALPFESRSGAAKFEMTLALVEIGQEIAGSLEYDPTLFDVSTVVRLTEQLRTLAQEAVFGPDRHLSELSSFTRAARHQLLVEWNDCGTELPRLCVHELFAEQARRTPHAMAVEQGDERLTYSELESRANRLARLLCQNGVGPEIPVGIAAERSPGMIVGLLAVLKAGGYYLPLDPQAPAERLILLLEEAGVRLVLAANSLAEKLPSSRARVIPLESWTMVEERGGPVIWTDPDNLAYVMFTSGSTGRPKGVAVPHRAIVRLVRETDYVRLGRKDRIAHASHTSFDAATFEIWGALLNGGAVVVISKEISLTPAVLARLLRKERVTVLFLTTALFNQVVREEPGAFASLRYLLFGGETVDPSAVARALERGPKRLLHVYGPTESTTYATWHPVAGVPPGAASVPVGRPIRNTWIYVVGREWQLQPVGAPGELFIGGEGLARGYLARPDLTADAFVPDPFGAPGARCYRTGDRVRWLADGTVEFLGRLDHQVKIRGFRIEPGEIEAALVRHPGVRECVVVVRVHGADKRLVAYVVPEPGESLATGDLRDWLRQTLPEYMLPAVFVWMDGLPLTSSGKVDRHCLPEPDPAGLGAEAASEAPRTPTEELIAGLWEEVLGIGRVGIHDGFFELGGHSLLAVQIVSRVREAFGVDVPLRWLFEHPTVAEIAEQVEAALLEARGLALPPVEPVQRRGPLPLSFPQERLWFIDQLEPGSAAYNMPSFVRLAGRLDTSALLRSLTAVAARHEVLRTRFTAVDGTPVQVIDPAKPISLPLVDLGSLDAEDREPVARSLAKAEAKRPFDLATGPVCRFVLLLLGPDDHLLCSTLHHISSDAWSLKILLDEVMALYRAFATGREARLAELPVQYADFAAWQRRVLQGEVLERQLDYWRRHLGGNPPVLSLPYDRVRSGAPSHRGKRLRFELRPDLAVRLVELSRQEGATIFMTLLAAFDLLLLRLSRQEDLVVGVSIANRNRRETEGLIGFFINMLAMRIDLSGDPTFRELLQRVRKVVLEGLTHQDLPYAQLVQELRLERDLGSASLFQVVFNFSSLKPRKKEPENSDEMRTLPFGLGDESVRWNLMLTVSEREGTLSGSWSYTTDLFESATIERLHAGFETLLRQIVERPDARLYEVEMLGPEERESQAQQERALAESQRSKLLSIRPKMIRTDPARMNPEEENER